MSNTITSKYSQCSIYTYIYLAFLFCAYCLIILYVYAKFGQSISKDFRDTGLNSRVDARVIANVDGRTYGWTDVRMDGKPDPYIAPCMRQARLQKGICSCRKQLAGRVHHFFSFLCSSLVPVSRGWSGGSMVLGKFSVPGRPTNLVNSRARASCSYIRCGLGLFGHFFSRLFFLFSFSVSGRRADID